MAISIGNRAVRKMALHLLDNFNGVDIKAYEILSVMLTETENEDILEHVDIYKDSERHCAFIGEDYAEEELAKIAEAEEAEKPVELEAEYPCNWDKPEEHDRDETND